MMGAMIGPRIDEGQPRAGPRNLLCGLFTPSETVMATEGFLITRSAPDFIGRRRVVEVLAVAAWRGSFLAISIDARLM